MQPQTVQSPRNLPEDPNVLVSETVKWVKTFRDIMVEFLETGLSDENLGKAVSIFERGQAAFQNAVFYSKSITGQFKGNDEASRGAAIRLSQELHTQGLDSLFATLQTLGSSSPMPLIAETQDQNIREDTL